MLKSVNYKNECTLDQYAPFLVIMGEVLTDFFPHIKKGKSWK